MHKPVTRVIRRQPIGPKPHWQGLFLEPVYPPTQNDQLADDEQDEEWEDAIITP